MPGEGVPPEKERVAAWLEYFNDLRIGGFYRNRGGGKSSVAAAKKFASAAPRPVPVKTPPAPSKPSTSTMKLPPLSAATSASASKVTVLPVAHGPSLFEAFERVANDTLERIRADIGDCTRCRLCERRNKIVFGVGNPKADLVFVGEGPGRDEDAQGEPFVGRAGQLLNNMIKAMGLRREDVYIANVVKCRPPGNRTPERDECETCSPFLMRQIAVIKPKVIVALGAVAAKNLLAINAPMSELRGRFYDFKPAGVRSSDPSWPGARLAVTYHPAFLLRDPRQKREAWKDLQMVMKYLGIEPPKKAAE
jgi:DNA polymerase